MVKITLPQDIPAWLYDKYTATLTVALPDEIVRKRYAWTLRHVQTVLGHPSLLQLIHRATFLDCVHCFHAQPDSGGSTPPDYGPRNRSWWYSQAGAMWYYTYFIQQTIISYLADTTPDWCKDLLQAGVYVCQEHPDTNYEYASRLHLANIISPPIERWIFIKNDKIGFRKIMLWLTSVFTGPNLEKDLIVRCFEVTEPWDKGTITWNNKPALGPLIWEEYIKFEGAQYYAFLIGRLTSSACLTMVQGQAQQWTFDDVWSGVPFVTRGFISA